MGKRESTLAAGRGAPIADESGTASPANGGLSGNARPPGRPGRSHAARDAEVRKNRAWLMAAFTMFGS